MIFPFSASQADILNNLLRWQTTILGGFLFDQVGECNASPVHNDLRRP